MTEQGDHSDKDYQDYLKSIKYKGLTPAEKSRWRDIERKYGLSKDQYEKMLKSQNGLCLGCGLVPKKMCVDHDHVTGKVRGLICSDCNFVVGFVKDNPDTLTNLARYLRNHLKKQS